MAIAFVTNGKAASGTLSIDCTGGTGLVILVEGDTLNPTCTYNGVSMTRAGQTQSPGGTTVNMFFLLNPTTGVNNAIASGGSFFEIEGAVFSGVAAFSGGTQATTLSANVSLTINVTEVANGFVISGGSSNNGSVPMTASTGITNTIYNNINATILCLGYSTAGSAGVVSQTWNSNAAVKTFIGICGVSMEPSGAGATRHDLTLLSIGI